MSAKQLQIDTSNTSPPQIMSTPPTPTSYTRSRNRDTGFPEPFSDCYNTTLPHPDADLSPNASISDDPLTATAVVTRRRLSMLSKHRRTISQASTTPSNGGKTSTMPPPAITTSFHDQQAVAANGPESSVAPSTSRTAGSAGSIVGDEYDAGAETPPTSPETPDMRRRSTAGSSKRLSFFGRWRQRA